METITCPTGCLISVDVVSDQRQKITSDIQAAGQTANRLCPAYQCTALSGSPEDSHTSMQTLKRDEWHNWISNFMCMCEFSQYKRKKSYFQPWFLLLRTYILFVCSLFMGWVFHVMSVGHQIMYTSLSKIWGLTLLKLDISCFCFQVILPYCSLFCWPLPRHLIFTI